MLGLKMVKLESLKLKFHIEFLSTSPTTPYKSRLKNSIFNLELEF